MPLSYVIDKERRLVISSASGRVTFAEAVASEEQLKNDPEFNPDYNHLVDFTAVTELDISPDQSAMLARRGIFSSASRGAIVASDPAIFGMGRLWEAHHEIANLQDEVCICRDRAAALKWLGLPETL